MVKKTTPAKPAAVATVNKKAPNAKAQQAQQVAAAAEATKAEPVVAAPSVATEATEPAVEENKSDDSPVVQGLTAVLTAISTLESELRNLRSQVKNLQKEHAKEVKTLSKTKGRRGNKGGAQRKPSGFTKPTRITPELSSFLKLPKDTMIARTEATKLINAYIKQHNLQNPNNRKEIIPDAALKKLLGPLRDGDKLYSYFNLQAYLKPCYVPSENSA